MPDVDSQSLPVPDGMSEGEHNRIINLPNEEFRAEMRKLARDVEIKKLRDFVVWLYGPESPLVRMVDQHHLIEAFVDRERP